MPAPYKEQKFCINCKHHLLLKLYGSCVEYNFCKRPIGKNIVTGTEEIHNRLCYDERKDGIFTNARLGSSEIQSCGLEAKYFERKEG